MKLPGRMVRQRVIANSASIFFKIENLLCRYRLPCSYSWRKVGIPAFGTFWLGKGAYFTGSTKCLAWSTICPLPQVAVHLFLYFGDIYEIVQVCYNSYSIM